MQVSQHKFAPPRQKNKTTTNRIALIVVILGSGIGIASIFRWPRVNLININTCDITCRREGSLSKPPTIARSGNSYIDFFYLILAKI